MHDTLIHVPASVPSDSDEVSDALEVASASWEVGDPSAAIRWVRRAAEAADEAGDVPRMAALARAAAELETHTQAQAHVQAAPPADSETRAKTVAPGPPSAPPASRRTLKPTSLPRSSTPAPKPPAPAPAPAPAPMSHAPAPKETRVRVSLRTSVRDEALLVVRLLPEGAPLPAGAREAFLVMADGEPVESAPSKRSSVG
jgi:hypothetical protein